PPPTALIRTLSLHDALPISFDISFVVTEIHVGCQEAIGESQFQLVAQHVVDSHDHTLCAGFIALQTGALALAGIAVQYLNPNGRSEEHTSELQSRENLVCRL